MNSRPYRFEDVPAIVSLFTETVRTSCIGDYSAEEIAAWAPDTPNLDEWRERLKTRTVLIAEVDFVVAGFLSFEPDGHLDHLYVHTRFQRRGIASALYRNFEHRACALSTGRISTNASITARPFFESLGFKIVASQFVTCGGCSLMNYKMEKTWRKRSR